MVNFHNKYAYPLELHVRNIYGLPDRTAAQEISADADAIEGGNFVKVMQDLIHQKYGNSDTFAHFCAETDAYRGLSGNEFTEETAYRIFSLFESLIRQQNA